MSTSALKIPLVEHAPSRILKHAEVGLDFQSLMSAWGAAWCAGDVNRNTVVMGGARQALHEKAEVWGPRRTGVQGWTGRAPLRTRRGGVAGLSGVVVSSLCSQRCLPSYWAARLVPVRAGIRRKESSQ